MIIGKGEVESKVEACGRMSGSCEDAFLDKGIEKAEIAKYLRKLKNKKTGGSDGLVGELLKYGGSGMVSLLEQLFGMRRLSLGNGERALLLIQGTTEVLNYGVLIREGYCMKVRLDFELLEIVQGRG